MQQSQRAQATVNATIQETISGIAVAKNFRQEATIYNDFRETNEMAYKVQLRRVESLAASFHCSTPFRASASRSSSTLAG